RGKQSAVRSLSLALRILNGDAVSMISAAQVLRDEPDVILTNLLGSVLSSYRNPDPAGVHAIGGIVQLGGNTGKALGLEAASALRAIHTPEAVPYLIMLLDTADTAIHEQAVSGLSEHVAGMRI